MGVLHKNCCVHVNNEDLKEHLNTIRIFREESLKLKIPKKISENNENKSSSNENSNNNQITIETSALEKQKEKLKKITNQTTQKENNSNNNYNIMENNISLTRINSKSLIRKTISISLNDNNDILKQNNDIKEKNNNNNENNENTEEDFAIYKRRTFRSKSSVQSKVKTNLNNFKMKYEELVSRLPVKKSNATVLFTPDNNMINLINTSPEKNNAQLNPNFKTITRGKTTQNPRKDIEIIDTPLTEKQVKTLKNILIKEELITPEMNEGTINSIINATSYLRVRANIKIFSRENEKDEEKNNIYYMIEKGILGYSIDSVNYELTKHSGIGTSALIKNSRNSCYLYTIKRCYLFKLPIEKYKKIAEEFYDNEHKDKIDLLASHFFFQGIPHDKLDSLADLTSKIKYNDNTILIKEESINHCIYYVIEGFVTCVKGEYGIKKIYSNEIFGEIGIFHEHTSLYSFIVSQGSVLLKINHDDLLSVLGGNAVKTIIENIFELSLKKDDILGKYFKIEENFSRVFSTFQLKYYCHDVVLNQKEKKILLPISGTAFKYYHSKNSNENIELFIYKLIRDFHVNNNNRILKKSSFSNQNYENHKERKYTKETEIIDNSLISRGELFLEAISYTHDLKYILLCDESLVFECNWSEIEKVLILPSVECKLSFYGRMSLLKPLPMFKYLSLIKLFQLSNFLHYIQFSNEEIIIKDGPRSDKFYIIKSGTVDIKIGNKLMKILEKNDSFGDITWHIREYSKKGNFIASSKKVECYYISKEDYENIIDDDDIISKPLRKILEVKELKTSLDNLYYLQDLGSGAYGKVYLVHDKKRFFAVKTAEIQEMNASKNMANLYINEKKIMFSVEHPLIVNIINTFKTSDYLFFLMEYVDGITFRKYLNLPKRNNRDRDELKFYGASLACVLDYLQKKKIIHRDVKPDNLMLQYNGYIKVIDFGIAKDITGKDYTSSFLGTAHYMAPEIILGKHYNTSVDYWSMGVVLYEMFYGKLPFGNGEKDINNIYKEITDKNIKFQEDSSNEDIHELIKGLLNKNPKKRINSFIKIKNENFFKKFDFEGLLNYKLTGFYEFEKTIKEEDLNNTDAPFYQFIKNYLDASSGELDEYFENKDHYHDIFEEF